jgi:tripartite-type tricarboxylate transporter receptor subunit TctC
MKRAIAAFVILLASGIPIHAQDWPTRPVTMVVPFPAGGPIDVVARILAPPMSELIGQQIIIENVGGAGGSTGSLRVAKAVADGYQFLLGNSGTHTYSQLLSKRPPYSAVTDFAPVAVFVENSKVLTTRTDFPAATLPEFIAYAKANQAKMQFGSAGAGSATHMTCVLLNAAIGIDVTHVPYRGTGPAMQDMMAGASTTSAT